MALDEVARQELHSRLRAVLGEEAAGTLMEYLPPVGWADVATKRDLDVLAAATKRDIELCRTEVKHEIELCRAELKQEIGEVRTEIAGVRTELKQEIGSVRGEIYAAVTSQTRTIMFGLVGSNLTLAALAFAAASIR